MMDPGPTGGARRGKRRGRRSNGGSAERGGRGGNSGGGGNNKRRRRRRDNRGGGRQRSTQDAMPPTTGDDSSVLGGREIKERGRARAEGPPDAFSLFAAYYCGVTPDDSYQKPNIEEIARRHGMTADEIRKLLVELDLEPSVVKSSCDLENGLLDIRLAPAGISRIEIARDLYQEYLDARGSATPEPSAESASAEPSSVESSSVES